MPAPAMRDGGDWLRDPELKKWATPRQADFIDAVIRLGTMRAAAEEFRVGSNVISEALKSARDRASKMGYSPAHDMHHTVPDGFKVKGVSTYYDKEGLPKGQWVKSSEDADRREQLFLARIEGLKDDLPKAAQVQAPALCDEDLLTVYPQGDPHAGLYSWRDETGSAFDLAEYERVNCAAIDQLVAAAPPSAIALFIDLGDSLHADNNKNRTPKSGHELDVDGRHAEAIRVNMRVKRYQIKRLLEKHSQVVYRVNPGNHDPETALALAMMLDFIYEHEPRVRVVVSPNPYWYYGFGSNLIATCHGDGAKGKDLPLLMATDQPALWAASATGSRVWLAGHVHHKDIKDHMGASVEYHRTLAAQDAWSHHAGFRSRRTMEAITFHRTDGEIARATVGMVQINRVAA